MTPCPPDCPLASGGVSHNAHSLRPFLGPPQLPQDADITMAGQATTPSGDASPSPDWPPLSLDIAAARVGPWRWSFGLRLALLRPQRDSASTREASPCQQVKYSGPNESAGARRPAQATIRPRIHVRMTPSFRVDPDAPEKSDRNTREAEGAFDLCVPPPVSWLDSHCKEDDAVPTSEERMVSRESGGTA